MNTIETAQWAELTFGQCDLGDSRLTNRLIDYAKRQADAPGASTMGSCDGNEAASEGAYRLIRNNRVNPKDIDMGVFLSTAQECKNHPLLLSIQDTTGVEVAHVPLRKELSSKGEPSGFLVHTNMIVDAKSGCPVGIIDQQRWVRPKKQNRKYKRKGKKNHKNVAYEEKESSRWESSSLRMAELLGNTSHVITICDREADIFEFLEYHRRENRRFIVRCSQNRVLLSGKMLWDEMKEMPLLGYRKIEIAQRGPWKPAFEKKREGREARTAILEIRSGIVTLPCPKGKGLSNLLPISINVVYVKEINTPEGSEPLEWRLFTGEVVDTLKSASVVVSYYEKRWLIEEYHKSWKVGCKLEERPLQTRAAVERFMAISAHIGLRLLQFQCLAEAEPDKTCKMLTKEELECLRAIAKEKKRPIPSHSTNEWVFQTIAKLGGWIDTKRTGKAGWQSVWKGWARFQDRLSGWRLAKASMGRALK